MEIEMENKKILFEDYANYCGFDNLPDGLNELYELYEGNKENVLISQVFLADLFERFQIPLEKQEFMLDAIKEIEQDEILFYFTKFLVWDMCSARNRCDSDNYQKLTPSCMKNHSEFYSFLLLLACVEPSMKMLEERGVPKESYEKIPYQPMERQFHKFVINGDLDVSDFPWDMNFYTCSIFLMDRFLFIPYRFADDFTMYRKKDTKEVMALRHGGEVFRRDGQLNGINDVYDKPGSFTSVWEEDDEIITANKVNPMGYVEQNTITLRKNEWDLALKKGDILLALHVPAGPGYNPERLKSSMELGIAFYEKYFEELGVKGFWSESWLYDSRLSLILDNETSNIVKVQRQFYLYPILEGDGMFRYEAFGDWKVDPLTIEPKSSLQKAAIEYMKTGGRFNTLSMIVLKEEVEKVGNMPYLTPKDIEDFKNIVDSHLL
jgi:hypothetical protein